MGVRLWGSGGTGRQVGVATCVFAAFVVVLGLSVASAHAASYQRPLKETFGAEEQPTFSWPAVLAVDPNTGDVLVADFGTQTISRYHANGTPAPFTALGSNVIDGKRGSGGHTGAECETAPEPESCDETPQNGLKVELQGRSQQIAVDASDGPTKGDIYVSQRESNLVDIFSPTGKYLGQLTGSKKGALAQPRGVAVGSAGEVYVANNPGSVGEIIKFVPGGNPVKNADSAANFSAPKEAGHIVVGEGPSAGWLFVSSGSAGETRWSKVNEDTGEATEFFSGAGGLGSMSPTTGNPLLSANPFPGASVATEAVELDGSLVSTSNPLSRLVPSKSMTDFAVSGSGEVYVVESSEPHILVYGQPVPVAMVTADAPTNVTGTRATLQGTVNPADVEVTGCFFEWGPTSSYGHKEPCAGALPSTDSEDHEVHLRISGLTPGGTTYHFRVGATDANGTETSHDRTFTTAHTVVTDPASEIAADSATLNGTLRPEGVAYTRCEFEWEVASRAGYDPAHRLTCAPTAEELEAGFTAQPVEAPLTNLEPDTTYRFRVTTDNGTGEAEEFTTLGAPGIREVRALNATRDSAFLEAKVNPHGLRTTYRFEWGPTASYGTTVPAEFEPSLGSGTSPVLVTAPLTGLAVGTTYHYRVVATNEAGTTTTTDQEVETLDSCGPVGLPDHRCFEMVSPRDLGPVAAPGRGSFVTIEMLYQAAERSGALAFNMEGGLSDATKGGTMLYRASRSALDGWSSSNLNPPTTVRNEQDGGSAAPTEFFGLSPDLSCGVVGSSQPLSEDPAENEVARLMDNAGGANLYVRYPGGSYKLITDVPPEELRRTVQNTSSEFRLHGLSANCGTVVFSTPNHYAGLGGLGASERLYVWREGIGLRYLGWVPNGAGVEEEAEASVGDGISSTVGNGNVVSEDGSRVFFMAPDPAESGRQGVFVRENGTVTHDLSASSTSVPDTGATYQGSTPDGSRAYFTANAGLTTPSNSTGTDLYEYNFATASLTDLSVTPEPGGAKVKEVVGIAADGSHVYFTSLAKLVAGRGKTFAQNEKAGTMSLYDSSGGELRFVATVAVVEAGLYKEGSGWYKTTRVSENGRYLVFQSAGNVTGYESGGIPQAYLYDAANTAESTVCLSCRQDGSPSVRVSNAGVLSPSAAGTPNSSLYEPQSLVMRDGKPQVFFASRDRLAVGAKAGTVNLYEWSHGQVFTISSEPEGYANANLNQAAIKFAGASADGEDLYFFNPAALNWENPEGRYAVWDARVGGGFAKSASVAPGCDPTKEEGDGSCHGPEAAAPVSPAAGTAGFQGEGNAKPKKGRKKYNKRHGKHHKAKRGKRHSKKQRKGTQGKKQSAQVRHASRDRGAGK